jgi:hypothetical protein
MIIRGEQQKYNHFLNMKFIKIKITYQQIKNLKMSNLTKKAENILLFQSKSVFLYRFF